MALPTYVNAGSGLVDAGGAFTVTGAAPGAAGRIMIVQVYQDGTTNGAVTLTSGTNIENLAGTDNTWTAIGEYSVGASDEGRHYLWIGRSLSTTAPTFTGGNSTSEDVYCRMYEFDGVSVGTTLATVIENSTAGTATGAVGTSTSVADVGVTTLGADRLALNFIAVDDDAQAAELTAMTGETGGDWTYPVAAYGTSTGTDGTVALVTADMATAGTIDGGTDAITSGAWGVVGFALIPAQTSPTVVLNEPIDTDTYYFDGSGGITDTDGVWTDDAEGFDGVAETANATLTTTTGSLTTNEIHGQGTTAPTTGSTIFEVRARFRSESASQTDGEVFTDGLAESLGGFTATSAAATYSPWLTLATPSGGWTWQKVRDLEVVMWKSAGGTSAGFSIVEIAVDSEPQTSDTTPTLDFTGTDEEADSIEYQVQIDDTSNAFGSIVIDDVSETDAGFVNPDTGGDTHPFNSGENIQFTVQAGDALAAGTYYWRVRGLDPTGSNTYGAWSSTRSFEVTGGGGTAVKDILGSGLIAWSR